MDFVTLELRALTTKDVDAVHALFTSEFDSLPTGTLNPRRNGDFVHLLSENRGVGVGAFFQSRLVGYALTELRSWEGAPAPFALNGSIPEGETIAEVRGTLVSRDFRGRSLGQRLLHARRAALWERGVRHAVGMMLIDNFSSIIAYLRCGGILCGFDRDDYDLLNFAHYSGDHANRLPGGPEVTTSDLDEMRELFGCGHVCRSLAWDRSGAEPRPVYTLTVEFAGCARSARS